jgi:hypothetical protein
MKKLAGLTAAIVFLAFFRAASFGLGIRPALMHDDFEYTYPSFSLAERGNFGSPLLGPGLNIENRTYNLTVYYYATVHAALIRVFGDGPESVPLANVFHFALLAAVGTFCLVRRQAFLGAFVFLGALVSDPRVVDAARQGRPEMTAAFYLMVAILALWRWMGEESRRPVTLFAASAGLTAGMLSHTAVAFFALALLVLFAVPLARGATPRDVAAGLFPFLVIPVLYGYFVLTDSLENVVAQLSLAQGNVMLGQRLQLLLGGDWRALASLASGFVHAHAARPALGLGLVVVCSILPWISRHRFSSGASFFAFVYGLFLLVHFLCLKPFVLSYRVLYQPTLYLALALLAEVITDRVGQWLGKPVWATVARAAGVVVVVLVSAGAVRHFRASLLGQPSPFGRLRGALAFALAESGARPGDRVFVPSPFGFHLRRTFDVVAYPAPKYSRGLWSASFRDGMGEIWGPGTRRRVPAESLCFAMELAFLRPAWVVTWDGDYSSVQPFYGFLRRYPDIPGMQVTRAGRADLPPPYGGAVRVYRLEYSDAVAALDRGTQSTRTSCP